MALNQIITLLTQALFALWLPLTWPQSTAYSLFDCLTSPFNSLGNLIISSMLDEGSLDSPNFLYKASNTPMFEKSKKNNKTGIENDIDKK